MAQKLAIQIDPGDNVVTLVDEATAGDLVGYVTPGGYEELAVSDDVPFGHKVAVRDVADGERIVKYHEAIGRASRAIRRGEHVHVHNVRSAVQGGTQ
jgi:altronate dehydratase small subunit